MRTERDSMGTLEVPDDAYYGIQTERAVQNFPISGARLDPGMIRAIATIKIAAARSFEQLGMLDPELARAIAAAAEEVREGRWNAQFVVDAFQAGAGTSFHMNANEVIANRANEILGHPLGSYARVNPNDHVNMGQSTNDVFPTAMRLAVIDASASLVGALDRLEAAYAAKAEAFDSIVKSGRTHLQDAVPIRLGQEFGGYATALRKLSASLRQAAEPLHELGIGGSAVGTGLNTAADYAQTIVSELRKLTGWELRPADDRFEAMQSLAPFAQYSGTMRTLALELTRLANDLRLLSSGPRTGLAEIRLPAVQPGSSMMPGKVNPSIPEMLNQVCYHAVGCDAAIAMATQAGQLELNVMMPMVAYDLLFAMRILSTGMEVFRSKCVEGLEADEQTCRRYAERTLGLATVLNPAVGYIQAAEISKEAYASGKSVPEIARERGILPEEKLNEVFSPRAMTEPRTL